MDRRFEIESCVHIWAHLMDTYAVEVIRSGITVSLELILVELIMVNLPSRQI